ncbi:MAG: plasmid pRiA4b ORF-3 family protein [Actinobacteria bacterium]|nr:plasmid pRiA4b ORF-3 family protein [Actinomycetota bacterium]
MASDDQQPDNVTSLIERLLAGATPDQQLNLLHTMHGAFDPWRPREPELHPAPATVRGFRIRIDLQHTKPPVWRRVDVAGDVTLGQLHDVIQAAMGWTDSHLHKFRTGHEHNAPEFLTDFDVSEGDEGVLESDVRIDRILRAVGDRLWYEYDFGDGWHHVLRVEKVLDAPPAEPRCLTGRLACPPEDCGGTWGYGEIADWVRSGYSDALRPGQFESAEEARLWLPEDWDPDRFDLDEANDALAVVFAERIPVAEELVSLLQRCEIRGSEALRDLLVLPATARTTELSREDAARITEPFRMLLDVIGDGVPLTSAGYLKPADVELIALRTGVTDWWIGKANREDLTWPVADLRDTARALGLVSVRKGRLSPTLAAGRVAGDPVALAEHIAARLPLGKPGAERDAGWAALAVAGSETPVGRWDSLISAVMYDIGWRDGANPSSPPHPDSRTLSALEILAGAVRRGRRSGDFGPAAATLARAVLRGTSVHAREAP